MAPNVITLLAFLFSIASLVLAFVLTGTHFHNPEGMKDMPTIIFIVEAICHPIYTQLDALDGFHARRTKNGSPLGLLMDHGFDVYTCGKIIIFLLKIA